MKPYLKALFASAVAGLGALVPAWDGGVTAAEWTIVALAAVTAAAGVYNLPYAPTHTTSTD